MRLNRYTNPAIADARADAAANSYVVLVTRHYYGPSTRRMLAGFGDRTLTFKDRPQASKYIAEELRVGTYYLDSNESGSPDYEVRHVKRVPAHLRDMMDPISYDHYRAIEDSKGHQW